MSPYLEQDFPNRVFFGDTHLHTAFSARASMIGIGLSAIVLGALVLAEVRPPLWLAALVVTAFAVFHGHAHGRELPEGTSALLYSLGFVIATALLHAIGVLLGVAHRWKTGRRLVQAAGGGVALAGVFFLWRSVA